MSQPAAHRETGAPPALRCIRCGAAVEGTRHTRTTYTVGYYLLHTGRTTEVTLLGRDDEAPITYRRMLDSVDVVSCPGCFDEPAIRRLWDRFGDDAEATP